jgi:hypothetical protein
MFTRAGIAALVLATVAPLHASLMTRAYARAGSDSCDVTGTEYASCTANGIVGYYDSEDKWIQFPATSGAWARAEYGFLEAHSLGGTYWGGNGVGMASFSDRITVVSPSVTQIRAFETIVVTGACFFETCPEIPPSWERVEDTYFQGTSNSFEVGSIVAADQLFIYPKDMGVTKRLTNIVAFDQTFTPIEGPVYYFTESGSRYPIENGVYVPEPAACLLVMAGLGIVALRRAITASKA